MATGCREPVRRTLHSALPDADTDSPSRYAARNSSGPMPVILDRRSRVGLFTESSLASEGSWDARVRRGFARLYGLIGPMLTSASVEDKQKATEVLAGLAAVRDAVVAGEEVQGLVHREVQHLVDRLSPPAHLEDRGPVAPPAAVWARDVEVGEPRPGTLRQVVRFVRGRETERCAVLVHPEGNAFHSDVLDVKL